MPASDAPNANLVLPVGTRVVTRVALESASGSRARTSQVPDDQIPGSSSKVGGAFDLQWHFIVKGREPGRSSADRVWERGSGTGTRVAIPKATTATTRVT